MSHTVDFYSDKIRGEVPLIVYFNSVVSGVDYDFQDTDDDILRPYQDDTEGISLQIIEG